MLPYLYYGPRTWVTLVWECQLFQRSKGIKRVSTYLVQNPYLPTLFPSLLAQKAQCRAFSLGFLLFGFLLRPWSDALAPIGPRLDEDSD